MAIEDSVAQDQIRAFVERIERMEEEKKALSEDIKSIYAEAKGNGFDVKILRRVIGIRKQDANERMEQEALLELYMSALGMVPPPPSYDEERDRLNSLASKIEADLRKPKAEAKPDPIAALKTNPDLHIVSASEIKPKSEPQPTKAAGQAREDAASSIGDARNQLVTSLPGAEGAEDRDQITEQQVAPQPASDLAVHPEPTGQVADILPETANELQKAAGGTIQSDQPDARPEALPEISGKPEAATNSAVKGSSEAPKAETDKSVRSSDRAAPAAKYAAPGEITWETFPPEGVERGAISMAFGTMGQDLAVISDDLEKGRAQPIVKKGNVILDGWARYMAVRNMRELDGSPVAYPVVQYDGDDLLTDIIKLNVEGRILTEDQKRQIAAKLVRLEPARKDDIYRAFELWLEPA